MNRFQSTRPMRGATAQRLINARCSWQFQSTRPMRGATYVGNEILYSTEFQSTRPMRGATFGVPLYKLQAGFQSTRPMRGATCCMMFAMPRRLFQSTRPMRGATLHKQSNGHSVSISIHAPHAGRDGPRSSPRRRRNNFNPRAPCGARHILTTAFSCGMPFQSTRPMRGATTAQPLGRVAKTSFQSTRPMRGATNDGGKENPQTQFQSTRPMRGATPRPRYFGAPAPISIHAPHAGRDPARR